MVESINQQPTNESESKDDSRTEAKQTDRLQTGVAGLDSMLLGGIPQNKQVLIAGSPGVGKTLLSFQMLYNCAKAGIPALYITLEEDSADLLKNAKEAFEDFPDIDSLLGNGMLKIIGQGSLPVFLSKGQNANSVLEQMETQMDSIIKNAKPKLVCVDSLSLIKVSFPGEFEYRNALTHLVMDFRRSGITGLFITEMKSSERTALVFEQEFFIFDGILTLYESTKETGRELYMEIVKMRGTKHSRKLAPYDITGSGFKILLDQI